MTRRRWVLVITAFLLLLMGVIAWFLDETAEPSFNGRTLSEWVADLRPATLRTRPNPMLILPPGAQLVRRSTNGINWQAQYIGSQPRAYFTTKPSPTFVADQAKHDAAAAAIREIGTNAIPHMLRAIYARDGRFKLMCMKWSQKQKLIKLPLRSVREEQEHALSALTQLGAAALWAWIEVATNDVAESEVQVYAAHRISDLGRQAMPAVPAMLLMDNHREPRVWSAVCSAIQQCDRDDILLHLRFLKCADPDIRASAAWSLGMGKYPDMAIPALVRALGDVKPHVRREAVLALGKFGTQAASITNYIRRVMADPDPRLRSAATNAFHQVLGLGATD